MSLPKKIIGYSVRGGGLLDTGQVPDNVRPADGLACEHCQDAWGQVVSLS